MWWNIHQIHNDIFYESLTLTKMSAHEPRLLSIQFKILHNIMNCKYNLCKWKIKSNDECKSCPSKGSDTLTHSMAVCQTILNWISMVFNFINVNNETDINITSQDFRVKDRALNHVLLILKAQILTTRAGGGKTFHN